MEPVNVVGAMIPTTSNCRIVPRIMASGSGSPLSSRAASKALVDRLIEGPEKTISIVADLDGMIVGHILLSELEGPERSLALGPLGVDPQWRQFHIGTELSRKAIDVAREEGWHSIFVLGDPRYYSRVGFSSELANSVKSPYQGPEFQALELVPGAVTAYHGEVIYPKAFEEV